MVSSKELAQALYLAEVNPEDLIELLISHFHGARHESPQELAFPNEGDAALTLVFSKDLRKCEAAIAGEAFDESALPLLSEKIHQELITSPGRRFATTILFSLVPVRGSWRYENRLQLRPMPDESPKPPFSYAAHPLLMDFTFNDAVEHMTAARRRERAATRWARRLNVLIDPGLELPDTGGTHHWVFVHQPDGSLSSQYLQTGYVEFASACPPHGNHWPREQWCTRQWHHQDAPTAAGVVSLPLPC